MTSTPTRQPAFLSSGQRGATSTISTWSHSAQRADLEATINAVPCDTVLLGTPMDLRRGLTLRHRLTRARYEIEEAGSPSLDEVLEGL